MFTLDFGVERSNFFLELTFIFVMEFSEIFNSLLTDEKKEELANALLAAMPTSAAWFKLGISLSSWSFSEKKQTLEELLSELEKNGGQQSF